MSIEGQRHLRNAEVRSLARDYYVKEGYSVDTIIRLLPKTVSRKTVYNWKTEENWDELRKRHLKRSDNIQERIYSILDKTFDVAEENPSPKNLLAAARAFGLYNGLGKSRAEIDGTNKEDDKPKGISERTKKLIEDKLGVILDEDEDDFSD